MRNAELEQIFWNVFNAEGEDELHKIISSHPLFIDNKNWFPYGGANRHDRGNFGTFESQQPNAIPALVEKIINSIDALLMKQCRLNNVDAKSQSAPRTMQDAVEMFYGIKNGDFSEVSEKRRREIAEDIQIVATGDRQRPDLMIFDNGEGQHPLNFPNTFLSLHANNKTDIHFVQGKYNMGSTGAVVYCGNHRYQLIASKSSDSVEEGTNDFGFTIVRRHPLTIDEENQYKSSWYEYFVIDGKIPCFPIDELDIGLSTGNQFVTGSIIKMYSYQLPRGSRSDIRLDLWRDLNQYLYHPALPMLILDKRYGAARASQGKPLLGNKTRIIIDDRDKKEITKSYTITNSEIGRVEIEATVFKPDVIQKEFINNKAVIFTRNGQVHGFERRRFISQKLGFSMLKDSLLVQIDCTNVRPSFSMDLFMANRYNLKEGDTLDILMDRVINVLKSDDTLRDLNQKRKSRILRENKEDEELLKTLLQSIPLDKDLINLLKKDGSLNFLKKSYTMQPDKNGKGVYEGPSVSKRFPSIFKLNSKSSEEGKKVKSIPLKGKGVLDFETDVESEYLFRPKDRGELQLHLLGVNRNDTTGGTKTSTPKRVEDVFDVTIAGPADSSIKVILEPKQDFEVGDEAMLNARLSSPDGDLEAVFYVKIANPSKPKKSPGKKVPTQPALPRPVRVYEAAEKSSDRTWKEFNWSGDDIVGVIPGDNGNEIEAIAINMDSFVIKRFLSRKRLNSPKQISFAKDKFFTSVYLHSLFLFSIFEKLIRDEDLEFQFDVDDLLQTLMKPYSSFLLFANTDEVVLNSLGTE